MKPEPILDWFEKNKRDLPWRNTTPWGVMISEFMLQQTPVKRVLPKWHEWIERWPTPADLAASKRSDAITAWGRLGYPRRATRLYESAGIIATKFDNEVPRSIEDLRTLPGVGEYTAAAIASFAYNESALVMDINIRRFFARSIDGVESPTQAPSQVERKIRAELIPKNGALWAAATMELGALVCTARTPACNECPVILSCAWRKAGYPKSDLVKRTQAWTGTDRQCRGVIVQHLREEKSATKSALIKLWSDSDQAERALKSLIADHLIEATGRSSFKLAD
jgi:A/G-specific adenine glycosylase